jgi:hypothetical protein
VRRANSPSTVRVAEDCIGIPFRRMLALLEGPRAAAERHRIAIAPAGQVEGRIDDVGPRPRILLQAREERFRVGRA